MAQTVPTLIEAMLRGLVNELSASDAAVVILAPPNVPHFLARVGPSSTRTWLTLLDEGTAEVLQVPLQASTSGIQVAMLCLYKPHKQEWGRASRLSANAVAAGVDYLLSTSDNGSEVNQLVASRRLLSVTEEELRRIVLDVHDGPVQKIFASLTMMVHLRAIVERNQRDHKPNDAAAILPDMVRVIDTLELSLREIRTFLGAFQTAEMTERDLLEVLEALVIQHEQVTNTTVHFDAPALPMNVSVPVKIALYRILQEALSNAYRHAGVNEVFVRVRIERSRLELRVIDFGKGFTPPELLGPKATEQAQHIGLRGMRERVQLIGGIFDVKSTPGEGTTVYVTVPL